MQLEARLGTEAVALEGAEQLNSRDVDPAPARQKGKTDQPAGEEADQPLAKETDAGIVPDIVERPEVTAQQEQQQQSSSKLRHDSSEL